MTRTDSVPISDGGDARAPDTVAAGLGVDDTAADAAEHSPLATAPVAQGGLGLVAAAFGAVSLLDASGLKMFGDHGVPGPGFFPTSMSVAVVALGLLLTTVSVVRAVRAGRAPTGELHEVVRELLRAATVWIGFAISIPLMTLIGFVPATVLLIAYLVVAVERVRGLKAIAVIIAVPVVAYLLFVFVLGVELPTSTLFEGM
jgi:putative tricarboxylic transport membrane protein